jgi:hypothetical protein
MAPPSSSGRFRMQQSAYRRSSQQPWNAARRSLLRTRRSPRCALVCSL